MIEDHQRAKMLAEYFKVADYVQAYDSQFLTIKAWGVSASAFALGIGFSRDVVEKGYQIEVFVVALALAISFWLTETRFKLLQQGHIYRYSLLEKALQDDSYVTSPAILESFGANRRLDDARGRWRSVAFWPHVMFPHVIFVSISLILVLVAVFRSLALTR
jgi:hypothetical protein